MKNDIYKNKKTCALSAVIAALYIVTYGRPVNLLKNLHSPEFYITVATIMALGVFLVEVVHRCTVILDKKYEWRSMFFIRAIMQGIFGIVLPCVLNLAVMSLFFKIQGQNAWENGFINIDFPVILLLMVILNLYYLICYLLYTISNEIPIQQDEEKRPVNPEPTVLIVRYNGKYTQFNLKDDIIFFYRSGRYVKAFTVHGNEYVVPQTIRELEEKYAHIDFCRINRAVLINCTTVRGYATSEKRGSFMIIFKPPIAKIIENCGDINWRITREYIAVFRKRFEKL